MNFRKLIAVAIAFTVGMGLVVAKSNRTTKRYDGLETFDHIEIATGGDVTYTIGTGRSVSLTASDSYLSSMEVSVENGTLYVGVKRNSGNTKALSKKNGKPVANITGPALKGITAHIGSDVTVVSPLTVPGGVINLSITTAAEVEFEGALKCKKLNASVNTAGKLEVESLAAESVTGSVDCGGKIEVTGTAENVNFEINMGGTIDAAALKAKSGNASVTMGGTINCNVANLKSDTTMGGSVKNIY